MTRLLSVELIVESVDRAIEILVGCCGFELLERVETTEPAGIRAMVDVGSTILTLLEPSPHGPGVVLPDRSPRLSQLVFGGAGDTIASIDERCEAAGLASERLPGQGWYLTKEGVAGVLGVSTALVFTPVADA
jgi:hypothetical protein